MFQSTPPRGGRPYDTGAGWPGEGVSIHAPARGATGGTVRMNCRQSFQSTPPRGGRLHLCVGLSQTLMFQSTPPRGGRRGHLQGLLYLKRVSIHAPARGATPSLRGSSAPGKLFQSTPPRGGRQSRTLATVISILFQSTPPRGGRPLKHPMAWRDQRVSIHAPARGATPHVSRLPRLWICFNPRPRAGGDAATATAKTARASFNPRPRAGGDGRGEAGRG